ncbi:MAG: S8 family serine peptidase, partial [Anaerolineales bacterium]|nr:S8 family serine peptidase [Anaerolineales bacterium]
ESRIIDSYKNVFNGISVDISEEEVLEIKNLMSVKNVYRNEEVHTVLMESVNQINADEVWKLLDENDLPITGKGVTIGVIDTGVDYTHVDLGGCIGLECKVIGGYDFVNNDNDPIDDQGHGTHVAATAAGKGILKGVAPDAKVVAYKVLDSFGGGNWDDIIEAIERSVDPNQDGNFEDHLDVISLSLGGPGNPDDPISTAIDNAVDSGVVAVIAAGNSGPSPETIGSPGTARKAITVGAVDRCDSIAGFSSRGPVSWEGGVLLKPDLTAPGVNICAAQWENSWSSSQCLDTEHTAISGTSMATPHVSGAAALLLQAHPEWTPDDIKSALMSTSLDLGLDALTQGSGRINVLNAHNAKITTEPQSISFEVKAGQSSHVETISVKNLAEEQVTLTLSIPELKDQKGQSHDFASLSTNELVIDGGSIASFDFIVDIPNEAEGLFTGKIIITRDTTKYTIPFSFERISRLTLKAIDIDTDNELFPEFYLHKDLSSLESAFNGLDFVGDNFTFKVTSGTYTVYAIGQESGFDYILMGSIEVLPASKIQLDLEISDAQKYNVVAESLQRVPLSLYQWTFGFNTYDSGGIQSVFYQDPTLSNKTMYISNKPDNGFDTDILLYYHGVPARARDLK